MLEEDVLRAASEPLLHLGQSGFRPASRGPPAGSTATWSTFIPCSPGCRGWCTSSKLPFLGNAVRAHEQRRVVPQKLLDLGLPPDEVHPFAPLAVGVGGGSETAVGLGHLAQHVVECLARNAPEERITRSTGTPPT